MFVPHTLHLSFTQVLSQAQHEAGFCAFYEECGRNPSVDGALIPPIVPCLDYSPARPLRGQHYRKLKQVCSSFLMLSVDRIEALKNFSLSGLLCFQSSFCKTESQPVVAAGVSHAGQW